MYNSTEGLALIEPIYYGILVIDEVPAVGMNWWKDNFTPDRINGETQELHKELVGQLIARDKNYPSGVMLSVANEAGTHFPAKAFRKNSKRNTWKKIVGHLMIVLSVSENRFGILRTLRQSRG